jgi:hypothetical protein
LAIVSTGVVWAQEPRKRFTLNDLARANSSLNNLQWRKINTPLEVLDILGYKPFPMGFEASLEEALRQRPEVKTTQLNAELEHPYFFDFLALFRYVLRYFLTIERKNKPCTT